MYEMFGTSEHKSTRQLAKSQLTYTRHSLYERHLCTPVIPVHNSVSFKLPLASPPPPPPSLMSHLTSHLPTCLKSFFFFLLKSMFSELGPPVEYIGWPVPFCAAFIFPVLADSTHIKAGRTLEWAVATLSGC